MEFKTGELVICTTFGSWVFTAQLLKSGEGSNNIKCVVLSREHDDDSPWIWDRNGSCNLSDLDRSDNPLLIYGAIDLFAVGAMGKGKPCELPHIRDRGLKGITFQNISSPEWDLVDCDVKFVDCIGI